MKKYLLISLSVLLSFGIKAQEEAKYLDGAVPEVNGRVIFSKSVIVNTPTSADKLFATMKKWAEDNYKDDGSNKNLTNRVLLANEGEMDIACYGETYLVFKDQILSLDRAEMAYQLIINVGDNKCDLAIRNIKYTYSDSKRPLTAEEMITDKIALNKKKGKLNRYYDKFRRHTVDSVNAVFNKIEMYLNGKTVNGAVTQTTENTVVVPVQPVSTGAPLGFKAVSVDKIPASLKGSRAIVVSGSRSKPAVVSASWGGTTTLLDKVMALTTIDSSKQSTEVIDNTETYTISFFTEMYTDALKAFDETKGNINNKVRDSGLTPVSTTSENSPAFSEAWMIIECKKAGIMPSSDDKSASDKTYLGEIVNVWVK